MTEPTVIISLDLELSWGSFDLGFNDELIEMARWTHDIGVPRLLAALTSNGLSATWAVVGAMMRPALPDISGIPEVKLRHFARPWFGCLPHSATEETHPEWFGATLVEIIRRARPEQEIGFHSFSHVPFGVTGMTRERAIAEYQHCALTATELGISRTSFVYPRNMVAYLCDLREAGFQCFRDADQLNLRFKNRTLTSVAMICADFLGFAPCLIAPALKEGIVSIPGSLMIRCEDGWRKFIPDSSRRRRLRKGLERVRRDGGVFHVWFHPENLHAEWPRLENVVVRFLEELGAAARNGDVRCLTMGQLAREFLKNSVPNANQNWDTTACHTRALAASTGIVPQG